MPLKQERPPRRTVAFANEKQFLDTPTVAKGGPSGNRRGATLRKQCALYDRQNRETAAVILRDIPRHGGRDSGLVQWAVEWWGRHAHARRAAA